MGGGRANRKDPDAEAVAGAAAALYDAPLAGFTAERKRLATELRESGLPDAADHLARLAKPTASAWVVNRIHRDAPGELDALFAAGKRMRGGEVAAGRDQRAVLARLHLRAGDILREGGHAASPAMLRRVATTLQALSAIGSFDPDPPGQLVQDRDPPGFDLLAGVTIPAHEAAEPAPRAKAKKPAAPAPPIDPEERRRRQRAEAQRKLLERSLAQASRRVDARAATAADIRADLERAEATADRLRAALAGAEEALAEAQAAADESARALAEAGAEADEERDP